MPLPPPSPRRLIHTRHIHCQGLLREDGLWDIEGTFTDIKTETFYEGDKAAPAGVPYHNISVRLTLDDTAKIVDAHACIDAAPFADCPKTATLIDGLIGMTIRRGFMAEARRMVGGIAGCTHIIELLGEIAGTAFQTMHAARKRQREQQQRDMGGATPRPVLLNSCYALRASGAAVHRKWPDYAEPLDDFDVE